MGYFQSDNSFAYLLARECFFNGTGYLLCKHVHSSQVFIAQIENIVYFLFGPTNVCPFTNGLISKKQKTFRFLPPCSRGFLLR